MGGKAVAKYYLGIDVGTFETKGVLVNEAYEVVAAHSAKHEMENPQPNHFEQEITDGRYFADPREADRRNIAAFEPFFV